MQQVQILDKYRINPGNVGGKEKFDRNFEQIINLAIDNDKPIRIGGNWGSLQKADLDKIISEKLDSNSSVNYSKIMLGFNGCI